MKANVGMRHPVFALVDNYVPETSISYKDGMVMAEAVSANVTWNRATGSFRGNDVELDSDNGVLGYQITFEPSGLKDAVRAKLMGETLNTTATTEYEINDGAAPDIGFGYIKVMRETNENGVVETTYEAWWYRKLKFGITSEEARTKGESIEWRVPTLTGVGAGITLDTSGNKKFAAHYTFDTYDAAETWLHSKAGISAATT